MLTQELTRLAEEFAEIILKEEEDKRIQNSLKIREKRDPQPSRRPTIRQRYMFMDAMDPDSFNPKEAVYAMMDFGMDPEDAHELINHWDRTKEITSSSGPHTLAEWKLYERAKKMHDGNFSYRDAVGILARDAGLLPKQVKDIIGTSDEWRLGYYDDGLRPLGEFVQEEVKKRSERMEKSKDFLKEDPMKPILENLRVSSAIFQSIFSMAKLRDEHNVPRYLLGLMSPVMTDGWLGDSSIAEECNKYSCQLAVGDDMVFYFNFKRDSKHHSMSETPSGNAFNFCSIFLRQSEQWFVKDGLTEKDFDRVFSIVNGERVDNAVQLIDMVEADVANPLNYI